MKVWKQGVEIEFYAVEEDGNHALLANMNNVTNELREDNQHFHLDDSKIEYSSDPYDTIGELAEVLKRDLHRGFGLMVDSHTLPICLGCHPLSRSFASGHVHTSLEQMTETSWIDLRRKIWNAQPIIALVSQNSPYSFGTKAADVRLFLSRWAKFTDFNSTSTAHWLALAYGQDGATMEVRLPSSAPLTQLLAVSALIRVLVEDSTEITQANNVRGNFLNVVTYGSSSLSTIDLPKKINYCGYTTSKVKVATTDLFKEWYNDNRELFDVAINDLPEALKKDVLKFYSIICSGRTLSDYIYNIWGTLDKPDEASEKTIELCTKNVNRSMLTEMLPEKVTSFMPSIEEPLSITQLKKIIDDIKPRFEDSITVHSKDFIDAITNPFTGILFNDCSRIMLMKLLKDGKSTATVGFTLNEINQLLKNKIIMKSEADGMFVPGRNFNAVMQLGKEVGVF